MAAAADPEGVGRNQGFTEPAARQWRHDPAQCGGVSVAHTEGHRHGHPGSPPREGMAAPLSAVVLPLWAEEALEGRGADRRWGAYGSASDENHRNSPPPLTIPQLVEP
ncbi:hypothetical protein GCM10009647_086030 [Streptomyces sanglieri]